MESRSTRKRKDTYTKTYESTLTPKRIKIEELKEENASLRRETTEMKSTMFLGLCKDLILTI